MSINNPCIAFHAACLPPQAKSKLSKSALATPDGYPASGKWGKLCEHVPEHEMTNVHSVILPGVSLNDVLRMRKE